MKNFTPRYTIRDLQELAGYKNGRCLSKEYWGYDKKYTWQCEKWHTWDATVSIIKQGGWCPQCAKEEKKQIKLEEMQEIAESNGGKCLSEKYVNSRTLLKWQCKEGHIWEEYSVEIRRERFWCPKCRKKNRMEQYLGRMQKMAENKGGKCLSKKYYGATKKLIFQCKRGHIFKHTPQNIKKGNWCLRCATLKYTIRDMQKLAEKRGGKCLSEKYMGTNIHHKWQCEHGHIWKAIPSSIIKGSWCPVCAISRKTNKSIEDMRELAEKKEGKCLSKKYINNYTKLKWQCDKGHVWVATTYSIKRGTWCPVCAKEKRLQTLSKKRGNL